MPAEVQRSFSVPCRDEQGRVTATIQIWSTRKPNGRDGEVADLIRWPAAEAEARGEEPVQLRERGRYIYKILNGEGLALEESSAISRSPAEAGEGFIEPGDQCGVLPLTVVREDDSTPVARGAVEVRSVKLNYREHYQGMLEHIAGKCAGLLLDSRAPTRLRLSAAWQKNPEVLEQQLEFLRHTLESSNFRGAVDEVLRNPHRLMEDERREQPISHPFKAGKDFARQISKMGDRVALPADHPLRGIHPKLTSLPARIQVSKRTDFLDTAENRFVKMVLVDFRDFLAEMAGMLVRNPADAAKPNNVRLFARCCPLAGEARCFARTRLSPRCLTTRAFTARQPGVATEGGLSGIAPCVVAVSCGRAARLGWRARSMAGRREECGDALRVLAVLPTGGAVSLEV